MRAAATTTGDARLTLLVDAEAGDQVPRIRRLLEDELPVRFRGFPVRFPVTWDSSVTHKVDVATVADFTVSRLGVDPHRGSMSALGSLAHRDRAERAREQPHPGCL